MHALEFFATCPFVTDKIAGGYKKLYLKKGKQTRILKFPLKISSDLGMSEKAYK